MFQELKLSSLPSKEYKKRCRRSREDHKRSEDTEISHKSDLEQDDDDRHYRRQDSSFYNSPPSSLSEGLSSPSYQMRGPKGDRGPMGPRVIFITFHVYFRVMFLQITFPRVRRVSLSVGLRVLRVRPGHQDPS